MFRLITLKFSLAKRKEWKENKEILAYMSVWTVKKMGGQ